MKRRLLGAALAAAWLVLPSRAAGLTVQEAILRAKPAVALITARVDAEVTMNCGQGPVTVKPSPFVETGTGWLVDGRGWLITNAHVVDPVHRLPPWVAHELKKKAIDQACVEPALRAQGLMRGQRPDAEDRIRRELTDRAMAGLKFTPLPSLTVLLSNGTRLPAEVKKFSAPLLLDATGRPVPDSGRDLALLRVAAGVYPALAISTRDAQIGDPIHILGFPGVVLSHELLNQSVSMEASVTNGAVSGFKQDAIGQEVIQTDAPAAHGNSGGPAIGDEATLVGVMTFVSLSPAGGAIVQGFNFLIPARDVLKFLQGTAVKTPGESAFNPVWAAGLQAFFAERYSVAVARFQEANRLQPNLPDVKRALAEAEFKVKNPPPRPFPWAWATLGITLLSAGVYGGMGARRWWRNRFRVHPPQVIGFIEKGLNPLLVDVRTKTDYETSPLKLPSAVRLEPEDVEAGRIVLEADPKQLIVTYCTSPDEQTSARITLLLRQRGYTNVRILKGGLGGWANARLPVEAKSSLPSIGLEIYKNLTLGDVERRRFKAGEVIFKEGEDPHGEAYVVHGGTVEIRRLLDGQERVLNTLGEGELFGQMALFRRSPRSAAAVALSDVELLIIRNERLDWLIRNRPQLTMELLRQLSELVVSTDRERSERATRS
ncbi:MAG TPA: cyclic nucleotide-binding domain-containing protein [Methylomirabilota bacterium]|jgi:rhodanese-related sulfurtransferase|nr:cyclic nucleotide-binding domain-containing protein [Methylomirabilota bacterium]